MASLELINRNEESKDEEMEERRRGSEGRIGNKEGENSRRESFSRKFEGGK